MEINFIDSGLTSFELKNIESGIYFWPGPLVHVPVVVKK